MNTPPDELQRLYQAACAMHDERPKPEIQSAVLTHATLLAQSRIAPAASAVKPVKNAANWPYWKSRWVASVLLLPLIGLFALHLKEAPEMQEQVTVIAPAQAPLKPQTTMVVTPEPAKTAFANVIPDEKKAAESAPVASNLAAPTTMARAASAKSLASTDDAAPQKNAALLQAAQQGNVPLVQNLLNEGASLDSRDTQGRTPLMLAVINGHEALVRQLINKGANLALVDQQGLSALQHARQLGEGAIASLLE